MQELINLLYAIYALTDNPYITSHYYLYVKIRNVEMEFNDEYEHQLPGLLYFSKSIPTKSMETLYDHCLQGCRCINICSRETDCLCISRSGTYYVYDNICNFESYSITESKNIYSCTYECNSNCACKNACGNRLVQFGPRKNLLVKPCHIKGFGLFTSTPIKKSSFVCEYAGEIITEQEALNRFKNYHEGNKMNYIFCIKENSENRVVKTFIDPTIYGNIGRYINHSCEPNCKLVIIRIENIMPILGIFTNADITEGSEITYSYGENVECNIDAKECLCNSKNCKKYLPYDITLSEK